MQTHKKLHIYFYFVKKRDSGGRTGHGDLGTPKAEKKDPRILWRRRKLETAAAALFVTIHTCRVTLLELILRLCRRLLTIRVNIVFVRNQVWCVSMEEYTTFGSIMGADYYAPPGQLNRTTRYVGPKT